MSRCEQIRRYLKGQSEPRSASEIAKAEYEARRNAERKAKRAAQATKSPPLLLKPVPVRTRAETVEEFLARGGVLALRMGRASSAKWRCVFPIGT